jgi:hypothetical protein
MSTKTAVYTLCRAHPLRREIHTSYYELPRRAFSFTRSTGNSHQHQNDLTHSALASRSPFSASTPPSGSTQHVEVSASKSPPLATGHNPKIADYASRIDYHLRHLRGKVKASRKQLAHRAGQQLSVLGLKINEVTGYEEVERLKRLVIEQGG